MAKETPIFLCEECHQPICFPSFGTISIFCSEDCCNKSEEFSEHQLELALAFPTFVKAEVNQIMD